MKSLQWEFETPSLPAVALGMMWMITQLANVLFFMEGAVILERRGERERLWA